MADYRHVDLGYFETEEKALQEELNFRACLSLFRQTGRWKGKGADNFRRRYDSARIVQRRSGAASGANPAIMPESGRAQSRNTVTKGK